jgi:hypothetical protein
MTFASDMLCTAGLAAFAAAVFGGGFYLLTYRPYAKKRESERTVRAAAARAGGLEALGPRETRKPDASPSARPHAAFESHS